MADAHANFAYSTLANSPGAAGTTLIVQTGDGALFPAAPFNATVWPGGQQPLTSNAEIVRVTAKSTDTFTISRNQEGSNNRTLTIGDQIAASITAKTFTDIESGYVNSYAPYVVASGGTGLQTIASASNISSTGSLVLVPFKLTGDLQFNQVLVPQSLSYITSASAQTINVSYYSKFGLYSMNQNTALSLISSNSFSIGETLASVSLTWNYPTSTATTGYGYGSFPAGNLTTTAQISSYVSGSRIVGLQFGAEMSLTGADYWLGILSFKSTAVASTYGLSHAGIIGQIMNPINQPGTVSGLLPLGIAGPEWIQKNTHISGWWGRYMVGVISATSIPNFGGTAMPPNVSLIEINGAAGGQMGTVLPLLSFVST